MTITAEKTVRELALEHAGATRVFEKLGIDYCCGGKRSLEEACRAANLNIGEVLASVEQSSQPVMATQTDKDQNWHAVPLTALIAHIQNTHHKYTREEIARLGPLFEKVCSVHGSKHRELFEVYDSFKGLAQELGTHMMKEDMVLFPYTVRMEAARAENRSFLPAPFGSVQNPVSMMEHEHDSAGNALRAMKQASNGYSAPADSCISYQTLYRVLAEFEADLHQHIHLENNILFPRAVAMEKARKAGS
jgi:regulator of cell morphogenesis and NO signaling